jgi:hypothetical protein
MTILSKNHHHSNLAREELLIWCIAWTTSSVAMVGMLILTKVLLHYGV